MTARPLFIGGTSSNAGKSWMATAICAWLAAAGVSVAPFKAQNMSNNSYPCRAAARSAARRWRRPKRAGSSRSRR